MKISIKGLIEIISHEGITLEWYYDSAGVPTIGIGQTKCDDFDPTKQDFITLHKVIDLFKESIKRYTNSLDKLNLDIDQFQYDALTSFCYNLGAGNLKTLCRNRSIEEIGNALMLYINPPEVKSRRVREQALYQMGEYSCKDGRVLIYPVFDKKPLFRKGEIIDIRPYFENNSVDLIVP